MMQKIAGFIGAVLFWSALFLGNVGAQLSMVGVGPADSGFTPASIPGLAFAISPDFNVTTSGGNITAIGGAWGTTIGVVNSGTVPKAAGLGPNNQDLIQLTGSTNFLTLGSPVVVASKATFVMVAAFSDTSAARTLFGSSPATGNIRLNNGTNTFGVTTSGGSVVNTSAMTTRPTPNLSIIIITYDGTAGSGTVNTYVNNQANPVTTSVNGAGLGFTINRLFATGAGSSPLIGFGGPAMIYNNYIFTAADRAAMYNFLLPWRGIKAYVAQSGSDSSTTFWNPSTPWQTLTPFSNFGWTGDETIYTSSTDIRRYTSSTSNAGSVAGLSTTTRITVDGGTWPSAASKTFYKASTAPTLTLSSGTIYTASVASDPGISFTGSVTTGVLTAGTVTNGTIQVGMALIGAGIPANTTVSSLGTGTGGAGTYNLNNSFTVGSEAMAVALTAANMGPFVFYCPGGTPTFGANYTINGASQSTTCNRLYRSTGDQTAPAAGQYGWVGGSLAVNQGVGLTTGDIEVPVLGLGGPFAYGKNNWNYKNFKIAYTISRGISISSPSNLGFYGGEIYFAQSDGFDTDNNLTGIYGQDLVIAWTGQGLVGSGGAVGDCISPHDGTQADYLRIQCWRNDKGGLDATGGTAVTCNQCLSVGSMPYRMTGAGSNGTMLIQNSIAVVSADATGRWPHGITNSSTTATVTSNFNTIYTQIVSPEGNGLYQNGVTTTGGFAAQNNIVNGAFSVGLLWQGIGTVTANHNNYFGPSTTYSGTTAGAGDITSDPLMVNPSGYDFSLQSGSPAKAAGISIPGVTVDYTGATRPNPPSIGAYN